MTTVSFFEVLKVEKECAWVRASVERIHRLRLEMRALVWGLVSEVDTVTTTHHASRSVGRLALGSANEYNYLMAVDKFE